jgi:glycosyltransferase involved in cell wall biosynthesis
MTPPTVLVVSNHGEIVGGGEVSLLGLLEHLDRARWTPIVVTPSEGAVAARCRSLGLSVHVVHLPSLRRPRPAVIGAVLALRRLIRATDARLVHANGSRAMLYAGLAGRLARRPVVWHVRVAEPELPLDTLLCALASAVIVNSRAVARRFPQARADTIHCIHNGVDLRRFSPRTPSVPLQAALGIPEGAPVVGSVGRFVPWKGYRVLLEAARIIDALLPGVHWLLVGDGEERARLEAQVRALGLRSRVHFTGWREDVPEMLALCDLFVLPSFGEHFGRVLVEAMAMGKAVVATDAGGVPEIVVHGECGLLVPPGDPRALAEALLALLRDPVRADRLGRAGRRRTEAQFDIARHAEAVEAAYSQLVSASHACL